VAARTPKCFLVIALLGASCSGGVRGGGEGGSGASTNEPSVTTAESVGGGRTGPVSSSTQASGGFGGESSHGGGGSSSVDCLGLTSKQECLGAGCSFNSMRIFHSALCADHQETYGCVYFNSHSAGLAPSSWRRETADGLLVLSIGISPSAVPGFEPCGHFPLNGDEKGCECLPAENQ
jgi:hypothetical protein